MRALIRLLSAALLVLAAGCGDQNAANAATVNGEVIPVAAVEERLDAIRESPQFAEQFAQDPEGSVDQANSQILSSLITAQIIEQGAGEELGVEVGQDEVDAQRETIIEEVGGQEQFDELVSQNGLTAEQVDAELRTVAVQEAVRNALAEDSEVTDEQVETFYEENRETRFGPSAQARHILVEDEATAQQALERVNGGEEFAAVAAELSQDPGSAQQGGDLGEVTPGQTVPEFDEAVFNSPVGELVGPVETQIGWHVLEVTEREDEGQPLEDVEDEIREELSQSGVEQEFSDFVAQQTQVAEVVVNPRFGSWDPATGQVQSDPLGAASEPGLAPAATPAG